MTQMKIDEMSAEIESREVSVIADPTFRKLFVLLHLSLARLRDRRPAVLRRLRPADQMAAPTWNRSWSRSGQNLRIDKTHVDVERLGRLLGHLLNDGSVGGAEVKQKGDSLRSNEFAVRTFEGLAIGKLSVQVVPQVQDDVLREVGRVLEVRGAVLAADGGLQSDDGLLAAGLHLLLEGDGVHPQTEKKFQNVYSFQLFLFFLITFLSHLTLKKISWTNLLWCNCIVALVILNFRNFLINSNSYC